MKILFGKSKVEEDGSTGPRLSGQFGCYGEGIAHERSRDWATNTANPLFQFFKLFHAPLSTGIASRKAKISIEFEISAPG
jgi:hypothetical protein